MAAGSAVGSQQCALSASMAALSAPSAAARFLWGARSINWLSSLPRILGRSREAVRLLGFAESRRTALSTPGPSPPQPIANALWQPSVGLLADYVDDVALCLYPRRPRSMVQRSWKILFARGFIRRRSGRSMASLEAVLRRSRWSLPAVCALPLLRASPPLPGLCGARLACSLDAGVDQDVDPESHRSCSGRWAVAIPNETARCRLEFACIVALSPHLDRALGRQAPVTRSGTCSSM